MKALGGADQGAERPLSAPMMRQDLIVKRGALRICFSFSSALPSNDSSKASAKGLLGLALLEWIASNISNP